jgi:hypothetical protein
MRAFAALGVLVAVVPFALGSDGRGGNFSLEQARRFEEFPLVFAGEEADGLPLTAVLRGDDGARYVSFVYGDCSPVSDGGCAPPAEVQVWPATARRLDRYDVAAPGTPALELMRVRGVAAASVGDTQLELYARGSTIVVFADTRVRALALARALRCVRGDARARDGPLDC